MAEITHEGKYRKVLTVSGAFLILLPVGVSWYWGNISVYILSYILYATTLDRGLEAPWILSLMRVTWTMGILCGGYFTSLTGKKHASVVLGVVIFNAGIFLSYFSTSISVVLTSSCMGGLVGFGKGLLEGQTLNFVTDWAVKDAWFLKSFVLCAVPTGAIIISQFATLHVNPFNLSPDLKAGHMMFFSQTDVLENVPSMFIKLGIASVIVQFIGILMLRESNFELHSKDREQSKTYGSVAAIQSTKVTSSLKRRDEFIHNNTQKTNSFPVVGDEDDNKSELSNHVDEIRDACKCKSSTLGKGISETEGNYSALSESESIKKGDSLHTNQTVSTVYDYTSPGLLTSCAFYAITVAYLCGDTSFIVFKNYYKSYGQQSIDNDHFLAEAVIVLCLIAIFVKIIWIFVMDGIGHITCMIFQFALMTVLTMFVYFSPMLNKWMYLFFYSVFNAVACSYDEVFTAISFKQFGYNIFNTNFGLVTTFTIAVHIVTAPVLQALLNDKGWFSIFAYSASLNFAGMLLLTGFYLKTSKCWNPNNDS